MIEDQIWYLREFFWKGLKYFYKYAFEYFYKYAFLCEKGNYFPYWIVSLNFSNILYIFSLSVS